MAIAVASGQGARHGVLIKNGAVLETLSHIKHFVFDKTGTLTKGKMQVTDVITNDAITSENLFRHCAAAEQLSEHSIAKAIINQAKNRNIDFHSLETTDFISHPGLGISAQVNQHLVTIGTQQWLQQNNISLDDNLLKQSQGMEKEGISVVHAAIDPRHSGIIGCADQLRPDAKALITSLRDQNIELTLLSGDRQAVAETIARQLGGMKVIAEVLPEDKDRVIGELQNQGELIAMVGDGINDAPALIRADVGIAIGSGTDVSVESADIVLMGEELRKIELAVALSRRTLRTVRQNIMISFAYNLIMVPLAMLAMITPLIAAVSMPISSLLVIGNAARIRTLFKEKSD
jgi:Cu2+-exporting ATPase